MSLSLVYFGRLLCILTFKLLLVAFVGEEGGGLVCLAASVLTPVGFWTASQQS